jgi:hypothetical protein
MKIAVSPVVLLGIVGFSLPAFAQNSTQYQTCTGWFALCTLAKCGAPPKPNEVAPKNYTCDKCILLNGKSVATLQTACTPVVKGLTLPKNVTTVQSRFAMTTNLNLLTCTNNNSWANCLNATCAVDEDRKTATCTCPSQSTTPYVSGTANPKETKEQACSGNLVISSESSSDAGQISTYWNTEKLKKFKVSAPPPAKE